MTHSIAWLVPHPLRGSGGHRTIYQNLGALAAAGYECHVFLEHAPDYAEHKYATADEGKAVAESYFGPIPATFHLGFELDRDYDVAFATAWYTAEPLKFERRARRKAYFIQDYEPYFMPMGDDFIIAQNSYRYGFDGVSIGQWLAHRLDREFGMKCAHFDFCADRSVYRPLDLAREPSICFVYQPEKTRRCSYVGGQALAIVKGQMPDVKIYFYGNDKQPITSYEVDHLGLLPVADCNELYNRTQIGLCISSTNPSRIPFEMMAAGLPVVDIYGENNLFDMPEDAVLLAEPTPESIAHALLTLLRDPAAQRERSRAGMRFMEQRDLPLGFSQFVAFVDGLVRGTPTASGGASERRYHRAAVVAPPDAAAVYRGEAVKETLDGRSASAAIAAGDPFPLSPAPVPAAAPPSFAHRTRRKVRKVLRKLLAEL